MYYLKRVIVVLEHQKYREAFWQLGQTLQKQNIELVCQDIHIQKISTCDRQKEHRGGVIPTREYAEAILYLTDKASYAESLIQQGCAVLAFLHEENASQDFGTIRYACEKPQELDATYMEGVYRRYKRIPWDILETDRCYVRETTVEDVDAFYKIYKEPEITRYTEGLLPDREQQIQYFQDYIDKYYGFYELGIWTIIEKSTGDIIGRAGLSYREGFEEPELGFVIGLPWQGKGFAKEVCRAILQYGREEWGFDKVAAFVSPQNTPSLQLCQKLGMKRIGEVTIDSQNYCYMSL
ncbi:MAG: GNAT family N-acetyltransferase [Lachnospiraceae bacterium]|nr:GNAT family N-acetyltransferase [Lachnospiraceae bacterium]